MRYFFIITASYELTQIIINNSDILLVKHYFDSYDAGLYASMALIGRVVYYIAWMFAMLLLPVVVELAKNKQPTSPVLFKYVGYISVLSLIVISLCFLFPKTTIAFVFGDNYLFIAPLLWEYALASSLFALSSIFAYYFLSLDRYVPIIITGVFGLLQIGLIGYYHDSLEQVVHMQIIAMGLLLIIQMGFYILSQKKLSIR